MTPQETLKLYAKALDVPDAQEPDRWIASAIRAVLEELADCERDHPPEPWASKIKAENERLREDKALKIELIEAMGARIEEALALHTFIPDGLPEASGYCVECSAEYPCPTVKALRGEE
jgi:hypothetical protein